MPLVAKSDHSTGNSHFASYVLKSDDLTFVFTAPYSRLATTVDNDAAVPSYNVDAIYSFVNKHGLAVRAVGELRCPLTLHAELHVLLCCDALISHLASSQTVK